MTSKVRKALDAVQEVLGTFDRDAEDLWAILTALRGPDVNPYSDASGQAKADYTARIRALAFPGLSAARANSHLANFHKDAKLEDLVLPTYSSTELLEQAVGSHLTTHIRLAIYALRRTDE